MPKVMGQTTRTLQHIVERLRSRLDSVWFGIFGGDFPHPRGPWFCFEDFSSISLLRVYSTRFEKGLWIYHNHS